LPARGTRGDCTYDYPGKNAGRSYIRELPRREGKAKQREKGVPARQMFQKRRTSFWSPGGTFSTEDYQGVNAKKGKKRAWKQVKGRNLRDTSAGDETPTT